MSTRNRILLGLPLFTPLVVAWELNRPTGALQASALVSTLAFAMLLASGWVHAPGPLYRLAKEVRAAALPMVGLLAVPSAFAVAPDRTTEPLIFALVAPIAMAALVGSEVQNRTLDTWLIQPVPRWRLLMDKLIPGALSVAMGEVALACTAVPSPGYLSVATASALLAVGCTPYLMLVGQNTLFAGFVPGALATTAFVFLGSIGGEPAGITVILGVPPVPGWALVGLAGGVAAIGLKAALEARPGNLKAFAQPRPRLSSAILARGLGVHVRKELRLQWPTAVVALFGSLAWLVWFVSRWITEDWRTTAQSVSFGMPMFVGLMVCTMAGICAVGSESTFGTQDLDRSALPWRRAWSVKLGVALGTAGVLGGLLPWLMACARPGPVVMSAAEHLSGGNLELTEVVAALLIGLALTVGGMFISGLVRDQSAAFLGTLTLGAALVAWVYGVGYAAGQAPVWLVIRSFEPHAWVPREWAHLLVPLRVGSRAEVWVSMAAWGIMLLATLKVGLARARDSWLYGRMRRPWRLPLELGAPAMAVVLCNLWVEGAWLADFVCNWIPSKR